MHGNFRLVMALCAGIVLGASALRVVQAQSSPPAYAVIQSTIIDQDAFRQFLPQIGAVIAVFGIPKAHSLAGQSSVGTSRVCRRGALTG